METENIQDIAYNKVTDFVKPNTFVEFYYYRKGFFYYTVKKGEETYMFPVPLDDLGDASIYTKEKTIQFMRYIRKALEDRSLVKVVV